MQHRQNSDMSCPLSAHNPRNESNSFLPRVPANWETLNGLHSSVEHLHTHKPLVPHGQLCQALPACGSAKEGMGWSWGANTVKGCCSWQNEGSGAELDSAKLSALDHLDRQLQRDQQILPQTRAQYPQTHLERDHWSGSWSLTCRREEEAKIIACIPPFSSCLSSILTIHLLEYTQ